MNLFAGSCILTTSSSTILPGALDPEDFFRYSVAPQDVATIVLRQLTKQAKGSIPSERRREPRYSFPVVIQLTPVDPKTLQPVDQPRLATGVQISASGLGFYHCRPIPHRCVLVAFDIDRSSTGPPEPRLLMRTKWCRFVGPDLYESGGQFVKVVK